MIPDQIIKEIAQKIESFKHFRSRLLSFSTLVQFIFMKFGNVWFSFSQDMSILFGDNYKVVTHLNTEHCCLTSVIERKPVHSVWFDRKLLSVHLMIQAFSFTKTNHRGTKARLFIEAVSRARKYLWHRLGTQFPVVVSLVAYWRNAYEK